MRLNNFISAGTLKNISSVMIGTSVSTLIPILTSPIMSRLFSTTDYGILGLYFSVTTLVGILTFSHYSQAIIIVKEDEEAKQVLWFTLFLSTLICFLLFLSISLLYFFTVYIQSIGIGLWIFLVPLSVLLNSISVLFLQWATRVQQFKEVSNNKIYQAFLMISIQITFGLTIKNEIGLMAGLLSGQLYSAYYLTKTFYLNKTNNIGLPNFKNFKKVAVQHKGLLLYTTPSNFINNLINQLPLFLLQKFGGLSYAGSYNFTQRFLNLPQLFLSSGIVEVFKQKASSHYHEFGNCHNMFIKTFKGLTLLSIIPFALMFILAPSIFSFVFGEQWREAGEFARYLSIMFFFSFTVTPLSFMFYLGNKLKENFLLQILLLILTVSSFYIGDYLFSEKKYLLLVYSLAYSIIYILYFIRSYHFSKGSLSKSQSFSGQKPLLFLK